MKVFISTCMSVDQNYSENGDVTLSVHLCLATSFVRHCNWTGVEWPIEECAYLSELYVCYYSYSGFCSTKAQTTANT